MLGIPQLCSLKVTDLTDHKEKPHAASLWTGQVSSGASLKWQRQDLPSGPKAEPQATAAILQSHPCDPCDVPGPGGVGEAGRTSPLPRSLSLCLRTSSRAEAQPRLPRSCGSILFQKMQQLPLWLNLNGGSPLTRATFFTALQPSLTTPVCNNQSSPWQPTG